MTTATKTTIENKMIQQITFCLNSKMNLSDMLDYILQDFDLNNIEISNLFNQVLFNNFELTQFMSK